MISSNKNGIRFLIELLVFLPALVYFLEFFFGLHPVFSLVFLIGLKVHWEMRSGNWRREKEATLDDAFRLEKKIIATEKAIEEATQNNEAHRLLELTPLLRKSKRELTVYYEKLAQLNAIEEGHVQQNRD